MKSNITVYLAVEDALSEAIMNKIMKQSSNNYTIGACYGKRGKGYLKNLTQRLNNSSGKVPFIIITDLDQDECAPSLFKEWIPKVNNKNIILRIAVHEVESWLLAHREAFAKHLGIAAKFIPTDVDGILKPKEQLINIARRSRFRIIRESIVPKPHSTAKIGPDYNGVLSEFVYKHWDSNEARKNSKSLNKAIEALNVFEPVD